MSWRIAVDSGEITALYEPATAGGGKAVFVAAHGAGSHRDHPSMLRLSEVLRRRGFDMVRFNFLYREKGSRRPDPMPLNMECSIWRSRTSLKCSRITLRLRSGGGWMNSPVATSFATSNIWTS